MTQDELIAEAVKLPWSPTRSSPAIAVTEISAKETPLIEALAKQKLVRYAQGTVTVQGIGVYADGALKQAIEASPDYAAIDFSADERAQMNQSKDMKIRTNALASLASDLPGWESNFKGAYRIKIKDDEGNALFSDTEMKHLTDLTGHKIVAAEQGKAEYYETTNAVLIKAIEKNLPITESITLKEDKPDASKPSHRR
ncbi:MAG: hypothetical protein EBV03_06360 [Proteobacteria bacterium]|nr:hypothetical protein [Pseudomonadota bacterium]